jgi:hypothetical protein
MQAKKNLGEYATPPEEYYPLNGMLTGLMLQLEQEIAVDRNRPKIPRRYFLKGIYISP